MNSEAQPDLKIVGYCRSCGKALDEAGVRHAQGTIFCEEHVPQEHNYSAATPPAGAPYTPPADSPYSASAPPPMPQQDVSPGLAAVLGLIPGVGAIYNGQYAKGFMHLLILGMLFTIGNSVPGPQPMIVLLTMGFWFYMAFEAYHTARRRRLGLPVDEFSSIFPSRTSAQFPLIPVLLIVFGAIILLDNLDLLDMRRILRYWPALLIALGVYLLAARRQGGSRERSGGEGGGDES